MWRLAEGRMGRFIEGKMERKNVMRNVLFLVNAATGLCSTKNTWDESDSYNYRALNVAFSWAPATFALYPFDP